MIKRSLTFLSKTKYTEGFQCPKLLWYEYNRKEQIPPPCASLQAIFDEGIKVGEFARMLFPDGIKLERNNFPEEQDRQSKEALKKRRPLFEAGFTANRAYSLADILLPVEGDKWDLIEVKSSTQLKDEHILDVAFQLYTYRNAGLNIRSCSLMHINNQYVRKGEIDPEGLFIKEDITDEAEQALPQTGQGIKRFLNIVAQHEEPMVAIGPHCNAPYECSLKGLCWSFLPCRNSISSLYRGGKRAFELMAAGITDICGIPANVKLSDNQYVQLAAHKNGKPYIDKNSVKQFLAKLFYPLYFLDFETVSGALPLYDNTRPYEQVPFQYSLHILDNPKAKPKHCSFLASDTTDPRQKILNSLRKLLKGSGSIVAYNAPFEISALERAANVYPEYAGWLGGIKGRVVDLLEPFRSFYYYHPGQEGSNSLKDVLPALTGISYKGMEISEGGQASREFARVAFGQGVSQDERARVYAALEKYCALDTKGMIDVLDALRRCSV